MSRNYRVLGAALVGVLVMMGLVRIMDRSSDASGGTTQSDQLPAGVAASGGSSSGVATSGVVVAGPTGTNAEVTDVIDGDIVTTVAVVQPPAVAATCSITEVLEPGATGESVGCLQTQLSAFGQLQSAVSALHDAAAPLFNADSFAATNSSSATSWLRCCTRQATRLSTSRSSLPTGHARPSRGSSSP